MINKTLTHLNKHTSQLLNIHKAKFNKSTSTWRLKIKQKYLKIYRIFRTRKCSSIRMSIKQYLHTFKMSNETEDFRDIASKAEEFRDYLETTGVLDALVASLVKLYQAAQRPEDPVAFLVTDISGGATIESSCPELDEQIEELTETLEDLKEKLPPSWTNSSLLHNVK